VIDANRDLRLSKEEIRAAWRDRATSQFLSGLIVRYESEWGIPAAEWDTLDDLMSKFGPTRNWMAEKQRIIALQWWDKIRGKHGFPMSHEVYHFHPLAVIGNFHEFTTTVCRKCGCSLELTKEFLKKIAPNASDAFIDELIKCSIELFPRYGINTCNQITHLLAQAKKETTQFTAFRESLVYSRAKYGNGGLYPIGTRGRLYDMAPSAINAGFNRKGIAFSSVHNKYVWCDTHLIENDAGYGEHCFGSDLYPGKDYRGRGLLHLTHFDHYKKATEGTGLPVASQPELVENDHRVIIETGLWFWKWKSLSGIGRIQDVADDPTKTGNPSVRLITKLVTGSYNQGLIDRQQYKREISPIFNQIFSGCADVTDN
jgi:predicted chitinase